MSTHYLIANQRVLILEEDQEQLDMMMTVLGRRGHECYGAQTSDDAIALMESMRPTVALVEIKPFEEPTSFEVGRRLQQVSGANAFFVAVLAWAAPDDRERTISAGFDAHVVKPITAEILRMLMLDLARHHGSTAARAN